MKWYQIAGLVIALSPVSWYLAYRAVCLLGYLFAILASCLLLIISGFLRLFIVVILAMIRLGQ